MTNIYDILPVGEENAISLKALSAKTGISERALRTKIVEEIEAGSPCLSSCRRHGGYYRPSSGEKGLQEIQRYFYQERSRARSTWRKLTAIRRMLSQCDGQTELEPLAEIEEHTQEDKTDDEHGSSVKGVQENSQAERSEAGS